MLLKVNAFSDLGKKTNNEVTVQAPPFFTNLTLPLATEKNTAPRPQSQARRKLSNANVVSTTSWMNK